MYQVYSVVGRRKFVHKTFHSKTAAKTYLVYMNKAAGNKRGVPKQYHMEKVGG